MDVRMPDGTIIQNVPDNMSQSELMQSLHGAGYDTTAFSMNAPTAKPAAKAAPATPAKVPWTAADYAGAAGRAVTNLPGDVAQLYGEALATGRDVIGGLMPWNIPSTVQTIGAVGKEAAQTIAGEIELGMRKLGLPSKPLPGKEKYLEDMVVKANQLNTLIDESAIAQAARGDFGPLLTYISERPAHAALNASIGLKSLAGAMSKAGYSGAAFNLSKAAMSLDPFAIPGKAGQGARAAAAKGAEMTTGKTSDVLQAASTLPTVGEATTNALANVVSGATTWAGKIFDPQSTWLRKIYGEDLEKGRNLLAAGAGVSETGTPLTMAERTLGLGRVEVPAAEAELVAAKAATPWSRRESVRKEQMRRQMSPLTQGLEEATETRQAATAADYEAVRAKTVTSDAQLESLLDRARKAVTKAKEAAGIDAREYSVLEDIRTPVEKAYSAGGQLSAKEISRPSQSVTSKTADVAFKRDPITGQLQTTGAYDPVTGKRIGAPAGVVTESQEVRQVGGGVSPATAAPAYPGKSLEQVDRALGELANLPQETGMTGTIAQSLKGLQRELRAYLNKEGRLPELNRAVENYALHSRRIDRIKVSQLLSDLATSKDPAGERQFLEYWKEVRKGNAGRLIKDATGDPTYSTLIGENSLGFNRTEMRRFENVAKEIERRKEYTRQASAGAGADIAVGESIKGLPHTLNQPGMLVNIFLRLKGEALTKKAATKLAELAFKPGNEDMIAAFDKAIKTKNQAALNAAYVKLKARQAGELRKKAERGYSTLEVQTMRNLLDPRIENQNSLAQ